MLENYEEVLTADDLQEVLNVGKNTAYRLLNEKIIKAFRIGRSWKRLGYKKAENN